MTLRDCAGSVKLTLSGSLPVMNSERYPLPRPLFHITRQPQPQPQQQQQPQPQHRLLPRSNSRKQAAATAEQQGDRPSQQAKAKRAERRAGGGGQQNADWQAKERLLRSHNLDLKGTAVMHRGIDTHEGEAVWQGDEE